MESPIAAILLGSGSAAFAKPELPTRAATASVAATNHLRIVIVITPRSNLAGRMRDESPLPTSRATKRISAAVGSQDKKEGLIAGPLLLSGGYR
jgi:hypothetical protein